jgi:hypothetical protein
MTNTFRKIALGSFTFVLMNWAAVAGLFYFTLGTRDIWNPNGVRRA